MIILLPYVSVVRFCVFTSFIAIKLISLYYLTVKTQAVAIFPLNGLTRGKDISFGRNPPGTLSNVRPAQGPDNTRTGSYQFFGLRTSFIYFPNRGGLDTKRSPLPSWLQFTMKAEMVLSSTINRMAGLFTSGWLHRGRCLCDLHVEGDSA